jgi:hypothetical protein
MREPAPVRRGFPVSRHLIEMIRDAVDFNGRLLNRLGRAICGFGRFVRGGLSLGSGLFGVLRGLLCLGSGSFGLLRLLLVARRASCERDRENQDWQGGKKSSHPR